MSENTSTHPRLWHTADEFVSNAITNNIVLAQAMGLCPIIAAGVTLKNGVALTVSTAVVMVFLGLITALIGNRLARWLRPAVYVVLSTLVLVAVSWVMETYVSPVLYARLYLFIPLMAINLLYVRSFGDKEARHPLHTIAEALSSTVGFGIVICAISALREMAISDTLWDKPLGYLLKLPEAAAPFAAFILLGFMSALLQWTRKRISAYFRHKEKGAEEA